MSDVIEVTTQEEFDAAIARGDTPRVSEGEWTVSDPATVRAHGSASVEAFGSATVWAYGSATVWAYGPATVRAYDTATVWAYYTATVQAFDSATVRAHGSATVWAHGSATVHAYDTATVRASDTATVRATPGVAVFVHSPEARVTGGVQIDHTPTDDITVWADRYGAVVDDAEVIVYKAVDHALESGHGFVYPLGETVEAEDWDPDPVCGGGLHFSPAPYMARRYFHNSTRFLRCAVPVAETVIIEDKVKARSCRVLCEVDIDGEELG